MKYKAVIADVDGTLMEPGEIPAPVPSEALIKAVRLTQEKGVVFSLATARSLQGIKNIIDAFKLDSLLILDNGALIYDLGKKTYVWESYISKEDTQSVMDILGKDKSLRVFIIDDGKRLNNLKLVTGRKISKIVVLGITSAKAENLYQTLKKNPKIQVTKSVSGTEGKSESIHVTNYTATKQIAVSKFAQILNIKPEEIIGIGDSYNDFPLLMACGLRVAMANATPDIKEIADYIAPSYKEDGVVEVLEKYILK